MSVYELVTYFRVCDGVRVRFADNQADSDQTVLLLAPWPGDGHYRGDAA